MVDREKFKKIRKILDEKDLDMIIIKNSQTEDPNFFYLSDLGKGRFERAFLLAYPNRVKMLGSSLDLDIVRKYKIPCSPIKKKLLKIRAKRIGVNYDGLTKTNSSILRKISPKARFINISKELAEARSLKTKMEISKLKKAGKMSCDIIDKLTDYIRPGLTENQIAAELIKKIYESGSDLSFIPIVASGPNSAETHHVSENRKLRKGDLLLIDFGVRYEKYCSDVTRTFVLGRPSSRQQAMLNAVKEAQSHAIVQFKEGADGKIIYHSAKKFLDTKYPRKFTHGLGHGLGIDVHDFPRDISTTKPMKEGMVFTVEPGVYIKRFGGVRIEDDIVVRKNRAELLTKMQKEFRI